MGRSHDWLRHDQCRLIDTVQCVRACGAAHRHSSQHVCYQPCKSLSRGGRLGTPRQRSERGLIRTGGGPYPYLSTSYGAQDGVKGLGLATRSQKRHNDVFNAPPFRCTLQHKGTRRLGHGHSAHAKRTQSIAWRTDGEARGAALMAGSPAWDASCGRRPEPRCSRNITLLRIKPTYACEHRHP